MKDRFYLLSTIVIAGAVVFGIQETTSAALIATSTDATSSVSESNTSSIDATSTVIEVALGSTTATREASSTPIGLSAATSSTFAAMASTNPLATSSIARHVQPTKLAHIIGTKYVDYFTDGTTVYSYPGDPAIDANLGKPNAPTPVRGNLMWVSTSAKEAYDTPSGDLEAGGYAQEADGGYIENAGADGISFSKLSPMADIATSSINTVATSTISIPDAVSTSTDTTTPQISTSTEVSASLATSTQAASTTVSTSATASSTGPLSATSTGSQ